ncbi:unnamed protein product [Aspergillus oryzae RIB40]|uniref:Proline dehydrogenase n=2 Tax=Aspergillus oryzae TaxID=5062 RepID=Q2U6Y1_ASPOR|nr:unnamed protein product [Aspergillus oryzae RIB40]EIT80025.1 hypothetical protein Ao3042_03539 [Aspergillus oryzae 3.042]KDE75306.1 hypothetical protein AO1008_11657 [Aspergillus oryzae 100-8]BAE62684.1 unnamed protein product [Aspergillus oryzae RIB40]|eukprot:EIT80025.1 hypothetical protein Ao3042_03539 [Aspergillus oryzae 3.042]
MKPKVFWPRKPETFYSASKPLADAASPAHNAALHSSPAQKRAPLADLPTKTLLRSLFLTSAMASPLLKPSIAVLKYVVDSKSPLLSPSKNPIMNYILRATIYNHFCAGVNETEVRKTVQEMKTLGFKGVILGYARESVAKVDAAGSHVEEWKNAQAIEDRAVDEWKEGNLRTLRMVGKGDYMNIKYDRTKIKCDTQRMLTRLDSPAPALQPLKHSLAVTPSHHHASSKLLQKSVKQLQPRDPGSGSTPSNRSSNQPLTPGRSIS